MCPYYLLLSTSMSNLVLIRKRAPHIYEVKQITCISNIWILVVLKLSIINMLWSYIPQIVSMLPTILHINFMLPSLSHEDCYPSFDYRCVRSLLLQNGYILKLNYAFEFRRYMSNVCVPALCIHILARTSHQVGMSLPRSTDDRCNDKYQHTHTRNRKCCH